LIIETFRLFVDNTQCKHIFFAGCNNAAYLDLLGPYQDTADRVTLIKAPSLIPEYKSLGYPMEELPSVFRCTALSGISIPTFTPKGPTALTANPPVCKFFQKVFLETSLTRLLFY
jgi:hypothetical protein